MQKRAALACIASSIVMNASVAAQQTPLQRCATIEDSLERLVCYDQLAQKQADKTSVSGKERQAKGNNHGQQVAEQARKKGQQKRSENGKSSEQRFGLEHKNAKDMDEIEKLIVNGASRRQDPYGNWIITLDNGQVWKQTESVGYFSWKEEDTYYIERGALNSFFFGREGANRRFRVTRVE